MFVNVWGCDIVVLAVSCSLLHTYVPCSVASVYTVDLNSQSLLLLVCSDTAAEAVAARLGVSKSALLNMSAGGSDSSAGYTISNISSSFKFFKKFVCLTDLLTFDIKRFFIMNVSCLFEIFCLTPCLNNLVFMQSEKAEAH